MFTCLLRLACVQASKLHLWRGTHCNDECSSRLGLPDNYSVRPCSHAAVERDEIMNELTTPWRSQLCIVLRSSVAKHIINAITIRCVYSARCTMTERLTSIFHIHTNALCRIRCEGGAPPPPPPPLFSATLPAEFAFALLTYHFLHLCRSRFSATVNCSPPQRACECKKLGRLLRSVLRQLLFALSRVFASAGNASWLESTLL